jgi:hypothetical protein
MPNIMWGCRAAILALLLSTASHSESPPLACAYDREKMLSLDESRFDQDMNGGWRAVARDDRCRLVAADLIRDYRELRGPHLWKLMAWHEGQLRAMAGDSQAAIPLLEQSRKYDGSSPAWNEYVDATIAFLKKDRPAFDAAYSALLADPKPEYWETSFGTKGKAWPLNKRVVEGLGRCFDSSYEKAYGLCGDKPSS